MGDRYTITQDLSELAKLVRFIYTITDFKPRSNIDPHHTAPVLVWENNEIVLKKMVWGLIPAQSKSEKVADRLINVKAETLTTKPSFKKPFQTQRCLIPANGYFEWRRSGKSKTSFLFTMTDNKFFCIAGLWDRWTRPHQDGELGLDDTGPNLKQLIETFAMITTEPNEMVAKINNRMPAILGQEHYSDWLEPRSEPRLLKTLLKPFPSQNGLWASFAVDDGQE